MTGNTQRRQNNGVTKDDNERPQKRNVPLSHLPFPLILWHRMHIIQTAKTANEKTEKKKTWHPQTCCRRSFWDPDLFERALYPLRDTLSLPTSKSKWKYNNTRGLLLVSFHALMRTGYFEAYCTSQNQSLWDCTRSCLPWGNLNIRVYICKIAHVSFLTGMRDKFPILNKGTNENETTWNHHSLLKSFSFCLCLHFLPWF